MRRIQLDFADEKVSDIKSLMTAAKIDTYKELFDNALTLFTWAVRERQAGRSLVFVDPDEKRYREFVLPALEQAAKAAVVAGALNGNVNATPANGSKKMMSSTR